MISDIGTGFIIIPIIGFVEDIVIAQAFARKNHYEVDATQELISIGVANIANSFVSGYPITGSFSRTAVNAMSGVATQFGGMNYIRVLKNTISSQFSPQPFCAPASLTKFNTRCDQIWKVYNIIELITLE